MNWWLCVHEYSEILKINQNQRHYQFVKFYSPSEPSMILMLMMYHHWVCLALRSMGFFLMNFWVNFQHCNFSSKKQVEIFSSYLLRNRGSILCKRWWTKAVSRSTIKEFLFRKRYNGKLKGIRGSVWKLFFISETRICDNFWV